MAISEFTPSKATVHTAIGRWLSAPETPGDAPEPAYVPALTIRGRVDVPLRDVGQDFDRVLGAPQFNIHTLPTNGE